jgi:hypothetical protein
VGPIWKFSIVLLVLILGCGERRPRQVNTGIVVKVDYFGDDNSRMIVHLEDGRTIEINDHLFQARNWHIGKKYSIETDGWGYLAGERVKLLGEDDGR